MHDVFCHILRYFWISGAMMRLSERKESVLSFAEREHLRGSGRKGTAII